MNDGVDYTFMSQPIALRQSGQLVCLDRSGYTLSIQGFGPNEPMQALKCGMEAHLRWLMTDSQLIIYGVPQKNSWITKNISQEAMSVTSIVTDYSEELDAVVFALCASNSLLVIKIKGGKITEYRLPNIKQIGGISIFREELSIIAHNNERLEHILIRETASVTAPILEHPRDRRLLEELKRKLGYSRNIPNMENEFSILFYCEEKTETYLVLSYPSSGVSKVFFIVVKEGLEKEIVLFLQEVTPIQFLKCSTDKNLCYFLEVKTGKMLCVKLEKGECAWSTCLLDGKENVWMNMTIEFQYSPEIGVYGVAEGERETLLISEFGLDFISMHVLAESVSIK